MKPRLILANLLLIAVAILLPLSVIEIALRIASPQLAAIYEPDPVYLHRLVPGGLKIYKQGAINGGGFVPIHVNSDGFRGPELRTDSKLKRVVVYGDSFVEGEFSPDSQLFVTKLAEELHTRRGDSLEIVNAGVIGYGPDQELLRMRAELDKLHPSAVVFATFADNDLGDLIRNRLFRLSADSQLVENHPVISPAVADYLNHHAHPTGIYKFHLARWIGRKFEQRKGGAEGGVMSGMKPGEDYPAFRDYMPWALEKGEQAYQDFVVAHNDTVKAIMGDHYDADIAVHPDSPSARYKLAVMERVLAAWKSTLAERNIPLLFLIIPSPIDVCAKYDFSVDSVQYPMYDRRRITREVEGMAQRQGLRSVSLWDSYLATGGCGMYFKNGNNHWNVAGQALAAKITADSLFALGIPK